MAGDFEISEDMLGRSAVFVAAEKWCDAEIQVVRVVEGRETIVNECKKYQVHLQAATVISRVKGAEELSILPYYDPSFVEGRPYG